MLICTYDKVLSQSFFRHYKGIIINFIYIYVYIYIYIKQRSHAGVHEVLSSDTLILQLTFFYLIQ